MSLGETSLQATTTRRSFVLGSSLAALAAATSGLAGCAETSVEKNSAGEEGATSEFDGWRSASCWANCGGKCVNKVLVKNGVVVRQKTDDTEPDTEENPQIRSCQRGHALRNHVLGADRIKYPMKRKHWKPNGEGDNSLRGEDEWERISWEEALDYIADETARIRETYGYNSILIPAGDDLFKVYGQTGGYTRHWVTGSAGYFQMASPAGMDLNVASNDRFDYANADYIILWGSNPAWSTPTNIMYYHQLAKKDNPNIKFYAIDPFYNDSYVSLDAEWVPIRPATDNSALLAIAYVLLAEDDPDANPLVDWDFLDRCTIGFDSASLPEGANPEDNFKDYVLGVYDGVPKTPEWAESISGIPAEKIVELARVLGCQNKTMLITSFAPGRASGAQNFPQMILTIGAMGGHMGKSGHATGVARCTFGGDYRPQLVGPTMIYATEPCGNTMVDTGIPFVEGNPVDDRIGAWTFWKAIQDKHYTWQGFYPPLYTSEYEERDIDIKMLYWGGLNGWGDGWEGGNWTTIPDAARGHEVLRSDQIDFVACNAISFTPNAQYADIVLPVTSQWERPGHLHCTHQQYKNVLVLYRQVMSPIFEAKTDQWIAYELGKRMGAPLDTIYPYGAEGDTQQYFNALAKCWVLNQETGQQEPLITITEEDIDRWGVEGTPQTGKVALEEALDKGFYRVDLTRDDRCISYEAFRNDPEANPLYSESGKIEIYCSRYNSIPVIDGRPISPYPKYESYPQANYEGTFVDEARTKKGEYPFQMISLHYYRRGHSSFDNSPWLREVCPNPVMINSLDAEELGISLGDTVLVSSVSGKILRNAVPTNRMVRGALGLGHGSWMDFDHDTGVDKGGNSNTLYGPADSSGVGICGWNSNLVKIEKYDGEALPSDGLREVKTPGLE